MLFTYAALFLCSKNVLLVATKEYGIHAYLQYLEKFYIKIAGKGGSYIASLSVGASATTCAHRTANPES